MRTAYAFLALGFSVAVAACSSDAPQGSASPKAPAANGSRCTAAADCQSGFCNTNIQECQSRNGLFGVCSNDAQCAVGVCSDTKNGRMCTRACTADADCPGGYCFEGKTCLPPCTNSPTGLFCTSDGRLVPCSDPRAAGASCTVCGCPGGQICQSSTCVADPREQLALADTRIESVSLIDGFVYWSGRKAAGGYSTDLDFTLNEIPSSGGTPRAVVTVKNQLVEAVATDADAYYLRIWAKTDPACCNVWDGSVHRLARGSTTPTAFASAGVNDDLALLAQTPTALYFQYGGGLLERYDTQGTGHWSSNFYGSATGGVAEGELVRLVSRPTTSSPKPTAWTLSRADGLVQGATLPDLCVSFARDTARGRWLAMCGKEPFDVVALTDAGVATTLAAGVARNYHYFVAPEPKVHGTSLYWTEWDLTAPKAIRALDLDTKATRTLRLQDGDSVFALDDAYAYFTNGIGIYRMALSRATSP
jgi:hypothetical protein